jgi:hypothetical protein
VEESITARAGSRRRHANLQRGHDARADHRSGRWCLRHRHDQAERATFRVGTAAPGKVQVGRIDRRAPPTRVKEQRVEIRQGKTAADEDSGEE